jgi:hypothetical protein
MNSTVDFSISVTNAIGILIGDCVKHNFGNIAIVIILILLICGIEDLFMSVGFDFFFP